MAELVYLLCAATSIGCAALLFRGYRSNRTKLLLWSALCFGGLALNNALLVVDLIVVPGVDLTLARSAVALLSVMTLLFGLVWESR